MSDRFPAGGTALTNDATKTVRPGYVAVPGEEEDRYLQERQRRSGWRTGEYNPAAGTPDSKTEPTKE